MERDLWNRVAAALKRVPRRRPAGAVYDNRQVMAIVLWAALHERSINWACQRAHWPAQAWRRQLPDQSTMSRRLRNDDELGADFRTLASILQRDIDDHDAVLVVDGKPLRVSKFTSDPDAAQGWGAGRHEWGYKLHVLVDRSKRLLAWAVEPLNKAESVVARELLERVAPAHRPATGTMLLADASYDSNPLHASAAAAGVQLIAPRRRPDRGLGKNQTHHPNRLRAVHLTERSTWWRDVGMAMRGAVERFLGTLATVGGGLWGLPAWARRLHRVRVWVDAKMALHAARLAANAERDA